MGHWLDPTLQRVLLGSAGIGAVSGSLGCYAYLRRQSLVGDIVAHATLFGVVVAFLVQSAILGPGTPSLGLSMLGAFGAGLASLVLTQEIVRRTRVREDAALGVILAIFFGTGLLLLNWMQRRQPPITGHRGIEEYLFGMAAAMTRADVHLILGIGVAALLLVLALWKELFALSLDPLWAAASSTRARWIESILTALLVLGIVVGIRTVGVVLMVAMLVAPASAARQWTRHLGTMIVLAGTFGALSGGVGAWVSATSQRLPTGPVIVLVGGALFVLSMLAAPGRGVLAQLTRSRREGTPVDPGDAP